MDAEVTAEAKLQGSRFSLPRALGCSGATIDGARLMDSHAERCCNRMLSLVGNVTLKIDQIHRFHVDISTGCCLIRC